MRIKAFEKAGEKVLRKEKQELEALIAYVDGYLPLNQISSRFKVS